MVVTKKEFQEIIEQVNSILTKLDDRLKTLEQATANKTTPKARSQEKT